LPSTHEVGALAEARARRHYRLRGYRILAANVRSGGVELDIVCRRGRELVVCEVKDKRDGRYGDPLEMVDERKQERLRRGAEAWLQTHPDDRGLDLRFDVVAVRGAKLERIEHAF
jgi:putative endonuclease